MSILTKYHNMPTPELVSSLFDKRQHSPLIEELCQRLEDNDSTERDMEDFNCEVTCPVCDAKIETSLISQTMKHTSR